MLGVDLFQENISSAEDKWKRLCKQYLHCLTKIQYNIAILNCEYEDYILLFVSNCSVLNNKSVPI